VYKRQVPDYKWSDEVNEEFTVALDENPPPNETGNADGWAMATFCTAIQADAFENDVLPEMNPGLRNQCVIATQPVDGGLDFDAWLLSQTPPLYRKDVPEAP